MEKINAILKEIRPEYDFNDIQNFFEEGMLDSFDLVALVATLDKTFNISIKGTDILPENFCNVAAIANMLKGYGVKF